MPSLRRSGLALLTALAGIAGSRVARADDSAAAQALFDQAKKAMAAHRYAEACPKLEESLRLQEAVGTLLNLADCYEHEGKLASAWSKYLEVASKARAAGQAGRARIGRDRAAALAPKLSSLVVDVPPASRADGLEIRRDGTAMGEAEWGEAIPADAGAHAIEASAPGRKPWSQTALVEDGTATARVSVPKLLPMPVAQKEAPVAVVVPQSPPPAPPLQSAPQPKPANGMKVAAIVSGGVGVAGLGVGTVLGLMSLGNHNDASKVCQPPGPCADMSGVNLWRNAYDFGNASTVAFIIGGVGLAAGVVLWVSAPKASGHEEAATALVVGPTSLAWEGVW